MSYTLTFPALAPLASLALEDGLPDIQAGDQLNYDNVTKAESQYRVRKCMLETGRASPIEVQQAAIRCDQLKSQHGLTVAAPWGAVLNILQTLHQDTQIFQQQTVQTLQIFQLNTQTALGAIRTDIHSLQVGQRYKDAIGYNRSINVLNNDAAITVVPHKETGVAPGDEGVWFPDTVGTLTDAFDADIDALYAFYELPVDNNRFGKVVSLFLYFGITKFDEE